MTEKTTSPVRASHGENPFSFFHRETGDLSSGTEQAFFAPVIQPKLSVNAPGDKYEKEADAVADRVLRMQEADFQHQPSVEEEDMMMMKSQASAVQRKCEECEQEEGEHLQRKPLTDRITPLVQRKSGGGPFVSEQAASSIQKSKGGGNSLPDETRGWMESRFGADFSDVKVHSDSNAVQLSRELNAHAFTHGSNIYFNKGKYRPETGKGKRLLAHELTHVVQQNPSKKINYHPSLYRKKIYEFQHENSAEKISASQEQVFESNASVNVKHKDSSKTLRRCIAGCDSSPSSPPPSFSAGDRLAVNTPGHEGWVRGRLGNSATSTITSFPDFLKVDYLERREERDFFTIKEGPYNGQIASLPPGYLVSDITWEGPASVTFRENSSRSTPLQSEGTLDYGGGTADAKIYISSSTTKIATDRDYPLRLPDAPHAGGSSYGDYAKTWFHIAGGPQGDEYLHRGRLSNGCVTVTSDVWPAIYQHLIKKRDGTQNIGTIRRVIV